MKEEVDFFGVKLPKDAIFDEDNKIKVFGCLILVAIASAFLHWCAEHPDKVKEIVHD